MLKLHTPAKGTLHQEINRSHWYRIEILLSKPNNLSSKGRFGDKKIPGGIVWIDFSAPQQDCTFLFTSFIQLNGKTIFKKTEEAISLKWLHYCCVYNGTRWSKDVKKKLHDYKHRKSVLWTSVCGSSLQRHVVSGSTSGKISTWIHSWTDPTSVSPQACSTGKRACRCWSYMRHIFKNVLYRIWKRGQVPNLILTVAGEAVWHQGSPMGVLWWDPAGLRQGQDASERGDADSICSFEHLALLKGLSLTRSRLSAQLAPKSGPGWCLHPPKSLFCHLKYWFLHGRLDHVLLSFCPLALPLAFYFSKWLNGGLFVAGWLGTSFVSQCFQLWV